MNRAGGVLARVLNVGILVFLVVSAVRAGYAGDPAQAAWQTFMAVLLAWVVLRVWLSERRPPV